MRYLLIGFAALSLTLSVQAQDNGSSLAMPAFIKAMEQPGMVLIDLRPAEAYEPDHLVGARHIDWEEGTLLEHLKDTDKDRPVLLYCGSGYRSGLAKEALLEAGYTNVHDLEGGMETLEGKLQTEGTR